MPRLRELTPDEAADVEAVFQDHRRFIEAIAIRNAPSPDHVPDIVQAVGVQLCRGLNGFRRKSELTTWLFRLTVNTARSYYQRERRQSLAVEAMTRHRDHLAHQATPDPPEEQITQGERLAALSDAIDQLRPQQAAVIRNLIGEAAVLPGSKATRHRARRQLRELLADDPRLGGRCRGSLSDLADDQAE